MLENSQAQLRHFLGNPPRGSLDPCRVSLQTVSPVLPLHLPFSRQAAAMIGCGQSPTNFFQLGTCHAAAKAPSHLLSSRRSTHQKEGALIPPGAHFEGRGTSDFFAFSCWILFNPYIGTPQLGAHLLVFDVRACCPVPHYLQHATTIPYHGLVLRRAGTRHCAGESQTCILSVLSLAAPRPRRLP